jgi:putative flippase GtrA
MSKDTKPGHETDIKRLRFSITGFVGTLVLLGGVSLVSSLHPTVDPVETALLDLAVAAPASFLYPGLTAPSGDY